MLARNDRSVLWAAQSNGDSWCALALQELAARGAAARASARPGASYGLLALHVFLRRVCGERAWQPPPLRASFVIDDPNLHWRSYGFLDYRELVAQAVRLRHHVGFAMVPLDGRLVDQRAAALVRASRSHSCRCSCTATTTSRASSAGCTTTGCGAHAAQARGGPGLRSARRGSRWGG